MTTPITPASSALLLVDLQVGVTHGMTSVPHSADTIVGNASRLVTACHDAGVTVIFVRVNYGVGNVLQVRVPHEWAVDFDPPEGWDELDPRLGAGPDDVVVVKHVASAFYGTDLDLQLRQRGITTLVVGGIATHMGVESTVRSAYDRGYQQLFVSDAMGAMSAEQHDHPLTQVFPLMGHVVTTDEVVGSLGAG